MMTALPTQPSRCARSAASAPFASPLSDIKVCAARPAGDSAAPCRKEGHLVKKVMAILAGLLATVPSWADTDLPLSMRLNVTARIPSYITVNYLRDTIDFTQSITEPYVAGVSPMAPTYTGLAWSAGTYEPSSTHPGVAQIQVTSGKALYWSWYTGGPLVNGTSGLATAFQWRMAGTWKYGSGYLSYPGLQNSTTAGSGYKITPWVYAVAYGDYTSQIGTSNVWVRCQVTRYGLSNAPGTYSQPTGSRLTLTFTAL
jgi:hypothetical protein